MTTTEAPALVHFQDCDDLALGRYIRSLVFAGALAETIGPAATVALTIPRALNDHRGACDCARLRAAAIDTQIARLTKARTVARNTGDEVTFARHTQTIAELRAEKTALGVTS